MHTRQKRGRPALPKDLPRERVEYDLSEAEKAEFEELERIGEEVSETLEYTPAKLVVIEHARAKYACRKDGESTIRTAFAQPSPLPKTNMLLGDSVRPPSVVLRQPGHRAQIRLARAYRHAANHQIAIHLLAQCAHRRLLVRIRGNIPATGR
jgi:hypothetical protein